MAFTSSIYSKIVIVIIIVIAVVIALPRDKPACSEVYKKDTVIHVVDRKSLQAEVVSTELDRERGLSGRVCIPSQTAMLFTFDTPGYYGIWMKSMKFPIDIVWVDSAKKVVHSESHVSPDSYPKIFTPADLSLYVIELHDGSVSQLGLQDGAQLSW